MMDVIPVSADMVFNYFFSMWIYVGVIVLGVFGALSAFRL